MTQNMVKYVGLRGLVSHVKVITLGQNVEVIKQIICFGINEMKESNLSRFTQCIRMTFEALETNDQFLSDFISTFFQSKNSKSIPLNAYLRAGSLDCLQDPKVYYKAIT